MKKLLVCYSYFFALSRMYFFRVFVLSSALGLIHLSVWAAKVDTVDTYSSAMKKTIRAVVITPDSYANQQEFPVVYLLHGYGVTIATG